MIAEKQFATNYRSAAPADPQFLADRVTAYYRDRVEKNGTHILKGRQPGRDAIMLWSNDYLALAEHPEIIGAQAQVLKKHGHGALRSDVFRNGAHDTPLRRFERGLAELTGAEDAVTCQSGWCANVGLIQSIADESTPVYVDMYAHASLWEGAISAQAPARPFKHNDPASLERMVAKHGPGVVVLDGVYSISGNIAPLADIMDVAEAGGCIVLVDESHSLGVFGPHGEGLAAEMGLAHRVHFRTASLSKAFASRGGVVLGSARNMEYLRYESRPAIFSSGILPHEAAGFLATLDVVQREGWRRDRLHRNADFLRRSLTALGYNVEDSECQIISLVAGAEPDTIVLRDALESRGVFGSVFCAPATVKNRSLVRFSVHSALSQPELERIVAVCARIRDEVRLAEWPSTKRRRRQPCAASA